VSVRRLVHMACRYKASDNCQNEKTARYGCRKPNFISPPFHEAPRNIVLQMNKKTARKFLYEEATMDGREKDETEGAGSNQPEKRPGPFAQDTSRDPPSKEQREKDYDAKVGES
jgi:hypothetical protein